MLKLKMMIKFPKCARRLHISLLPTTTGTISTFVNFHNLLISLFKSWYFSTFSFSFSSTLTSAGTTISMIIPFCSFLSVTIRSGRLVPIRLSHWIFMSHSTLIILFCSFLSVTIRSGRLVPIRLSHWIFMSHSTLISSFSTAPSGACSYYFSLCSNPFFLQISQ